MARTTKIVDETRVPHEPTDDDAWQESRAVYWCDPDTGLGGVVAIGDYANRGRALSWFGVLDANRRVGFQRSRAPFPLLDSDRRPDDIGCDGVRFRFTDDGPVSISVHDAETGTKLELELNDFYPASTWPGGSTEAIKTQAAGHVECSGRGAGRVVLDGVETAIRPLYHRDGSWGPRGYQPVTSYTWSVGTCGPAVSWSGVALQISGYPPVETGFVALDGELFPAASVRTLVTVDHDALTVPTWTTTFTLAEGPTIEVRATAIGHLYDDREWPGFAATDTIAAASVTVGGAHHGGFAGLNRIINPRLGTERPKAYLGGTTEEGVFRW